MWPATCREAEAIAMLDTRDALVSFGTWNHRTQIRSDWDSHDPMFIYIIIQIF